MPACAVPREHRHSAVTVAVLDGASGSALAEEDKAAAHGPRDGKAAGFARVSSGCGEIGSEAGSKVASRVASRAGASSTLAPDVPEKDTAEEHNVSDCDGGIGVGMDSMEVMGQEDDSQEDDSPDVLMRRMTTKKRSEARMIRAPEIPTIDTGSGRFDSAHVAEMNAAAEREKVQRALMEAKSMRLARALADEDEDDDSLSLASLGIQSYQGDTAAAPTAAAAVATVTVPDSKAPPSLRRFGTGGKSVVADAVGSADVVNIGSASFCDEDPAGVTGFESNGKKVGPAMLRIQPHDALADSNDLSQLAPPSMCGRGLPAYNAKAGALSTRSRRYSGIR